jgi:hypothetical protein
MACGFDKAAALNTSNDDTGHELTTLRFASTARRTRSNTLSRRVSRLTTDVGLLPIIVGIADKEAQLGDDFDGCFRLISVVKHTIPEALLQGQCV